MDQSLLEERQAQNWASATTAPPHFAARIIEIRSALLSKRPVPAPSRAYAVEAERRSALATHGRKVNPLPASMTRAHIELPLKDKLLADAYDLRKAREAAARALDQRVTDAFEAVRAGRNPFRSEDGGQASVPAGDASNTFRCAANSFSTSTRDDHKKASEQHAWAAQSIARKRGDNFAARADAHYAASSAHAKAADQYADDMFAECAGLAQVACNRCNQPSAVGLNKA
jgi:hypothetical protein